MESPQPIFHGQSDVQTTNEPVFRRRHKRNPSMGPFEEVDLDSEFAEYSSGNVYIKRSDAYVDLSNS